MDKLVGFIYGVGFTVLVWFGWSVYLRIERLERVVEHIYAIVMAVGTP